MIKPWLNYIQLQDFDLWVCLHFRYNQHSTNHWRAKVPLAKCYQEDNAKTFHEEHNAASNSGSFQMFPVQDSFLMQGNRTNRSLHDRRCNSLYISVFLLLFIPPDTPPPPCAVASCCCFSSLLDLWAPCYCRHFHIHHISLYSPTLLKTCVFFFSKVFFAATAG